MTAEEAPWGRCDACNRPRDFMTGGEIQSLCYGCFIRPAEAYKRNLERLAREDKPETTD